MKIDIINRYEASIIEEMINEYFSDISYNFDGMRNFKDEIYNKDNIERFKHQLERYISRHTNNIEEKKDLYSRIKEFVKENRITLSELGWIDIGDRRLCNWLWSFLGSGEHLNHLNHLNRRKFNFRPLRGTSIDTKEKRANIIKFFILSDFPKYDKEKLLENLKNLWIEINSDLRVVKILDKKNIKQCIWAFEYIEKIFDSRFGYKFRRNGNDDFYYAVMCYFDLILNPHEKSHVITSLKNAWNQKKLRDNSSKTKSFNFRMDTSISDKLTEMSESLMIKKNKLVEQLIEREYKEFTNKMKY